MHQNFQTPLSVIASEQLHFLYQLISNLNLEPDNPDYWVYIWNLAMFSSKQAYTALKGTMPTSQFSSGCGSPMSLARSSKFFFWLLLRDRLNTRNLLRRKRRAPDDFSCVLLSIWKGLCLSSSYLAHSAYSFGNFWVFLGTLLWA
jgi:hypothetical protein